MKNFTFAIITCATSVAFAQGAGSGSAAKAPADAKAPAADAKKAPMKMEMPKPPTEVAEMAKTMAGTWKCTGTLFNPMDATQSMAAKMTMTTKLDPDKAWLLTTLTGLPTKMMIVTTFDAASKKWYRITTDGTGGSDTAWGTATGTKTVWEGESRGMGMKAWKSRTTEEAVSPKETKMMGEMAMDGKTWVKGWEATCKK